MWILVGLLDVDHLILGTQADNINDKVIRDRQAKGEGHGNAKLDDAKVREIRALYHQGKDLSDIAALYQVSVTLVRYIVEDKLWKHVI